MVWTWYTLLICRDMPSAPLLSLRSFEMDVWIHWTTYTHWLRYFGQIFDSVNMFQEIASHLTNLLFQSHPSSSAVLHIHFFFVQMCRFPEFQWICEQTMRSNSQFRKSVLYNFIIRISGYWFFVVIIVCMTLCLNEMCLFDLCFMRACVCLCNERKKAKLAPLLFDIRIIYRWVLITYTRQKTEDKHNVNRIWRWDDDPHTTDLHVHCFVVNTHTQWPMKHIFARKRFEWLSMSRQK